MQIFAGMFKPFNGSFLGGSVNEFTVQAPVGDRLTDVNG